VETGRVQYILKDFPLEQIHPEARLAAAAARCAGEQDSYWPMHDVLFAAQDEWGGQGQSASEIMTGLAEDLGLNANEFQDCLSSGRNDAAVQADLEEGLSLGVRGTPFFFVDGFPINGAQPYALFEYAVGLAEEGTLADAYTRPPEPTQQPTPTGPVEINTAGSYGLGNPDAPVTIVEYTDYQCPYCQRHFQQTFPNLKTNYIDEGIVRYVFKDFPLTGIHPQAFLAAEAARCAGDQGAYLEMHDALFDSQANWSGQSDAVGYFGALAGDIGLDAAAFASCLGNHAHEDAVTEDLEEGIGFGVNGTPAFFINGHFLSGAQPFSIFEQAIASLLSE
jgi:protein-disulfide isomerase